MARMVSRLGAICILAAGLSRADLLLSIADSAPGNHGSVVAGKPTAGTAEWLSQRFTLTDSFTDMSFTLIADLQGVSGTVYLTDKIGVGTTAADVIASVAFDSPNSGVGPLTLLTGVSLGPGTYHFLVAPSSGEGFWATADPKNVTTAAGVTFVGYEFATNRNPGTLDFTLPPDSTFYPELTDPTGHWFEIDGVPATVPEPASIVLLLACLSSLLPRWRRPL